MAKKKSHPRKTPTSPPPPPPAAVTAERFARLHRLVTLLAGGEHSLRQPHQAPGLDVRGFYRDLETLRGVTIPVKFTEGRYSLGEPVEAAVARLPFPDPHLSLSEVRQLARGKTKLHKALQAQIDALLA
ncbi:MAG: hypothetical protein U0797_01760 [Gemmataceae bacterium]